MTQNRFGEMARQARKAKQLKAPDVAEMVGVSVNHLYEVEAGTRSPSFELVAQIVDALDMEPDDALGAYANDRADAFRDMSVGKMWGLLAQWRNDR